jgi:hypothetical protein
LSPGDELCGFEKWSYDFIGIPPGLFGPFVPETTSFVRTALMEGLVQEQQIGANPFQFGLIGATDSHNATPGLTNEEDYVTAGHLGTRDATPLLQTHPLGIGVVGGIEANGGGLAVVWAEENSRDALFAAMRRREVYGTSGTRPLVRFFAGRISKGLCERGDFVEKGYEGGVPMGGEIGNVRAGRSPRFAVMALKDPGTVGSPGTPLQRAQIIKGWVDAGGTAHEKVFEVDGDPDNGAGVDLDTCATSGPGFDELCEVWSDPEFDRNERAFYYARVVENPICRWSTRLCNSQGIDCDVPASIPVGLEECCNPARPKTIQERAWTSPIFYRPEGIARLHGRVRFDATAAGDTFTLKAKVGAVSPEFDLNSNDLTVDVRDDDEIYRVTIPSGSWQQNGSHFRYKDPTGSLNGLKRATATFSKHGTIRLSLATIPMDLSNADQTDHMVHTSIEIGTYKATHNRYWVLRGQRLIEVRR